MPSPANTDRPALYLGRDNELEWSRLHRAIELTEGFALYLISVQDLSTAAELIRRLQHGFPDRTTHHFPMADKTKPEVAELLQHMAHLPPESLVILSGLDEQRLPADFWVRFNERRNLWQRHSPHAHLWFVNSSIRQQIRTQAPDIYSIRSLDFLFTLPPASQERLLERASAPTSPWLGTAESLMAEANLFAMDQTPTGRLLYGRALFSVAQRLRFECRWDEALQIAQQGLALVREQALNDIQADFLLELGATQHRLNQLSKARSYCEEALSLYRQEKNALGAATALRELGDLHMRRENWTSAQHAYQAALIIYRTQGSSLGEANTLQVLGDLCLREADLVNARRSYDTALLLYRAVANRQGEANTLQALGNLLEIEGHLEEAEQAMLSAFHIHRDIHDLLDCAADLGCLGRVAYTAKHCIRAVLYSEQALTIYRTIHDSFGQALVIQDQGQSLRALGLETGGIAALWQAREIFHAIQDSSAAALDEFFARLEQADLDSYPQLMAELQTRAEELRQEAVAKVRETAADDPLVQQINTAVRTLLAPGNST